MKTLFLKFSERFWLFFEAPIAPQSLAFFRIATGLFSLLSAYLLLVDIHTFLSPDAWLVWEVSKAHAIHWQVHLVDLQELLAQFFTIEPMQTTYLLLTVFAGASLCITIGFFTRFAALVAWLSFYIISNSMSSFTYGVDVFHNICLFYLLWMPSNKTWAIDAWRSKLPVSQVSGMSLRVLQIHLCLVYLSAGGEKALMKNWWTGDYVWYTLTDTTLCTLPCEPFLQYPILLVLAGWATIFIELGYVVAMWIPRVRLVWLLLVIGLHAYIAFFLSMPMFGLVMVLLSLGAWGSACWKDFQAISYQLKQALPTIQTIPKHKFQ